MRLCLTYNVEKDLCIEAEMDEEHAKYMRHCFGEEVPTMVKQLTQSVIDSCNRDPLIMQVMLIVMTFIKGLSTEDITALQEPILYNNKQVFEAQSVYTGLLFRYMIDKYSSYLNAVKKYSQLIEKIMQIQTASRKFQQLVCPQLATMVEINPIVKSLLRIM
ncbi:unnamed protein product [Didymodactylos carnosus]|uniref:Uncharacterized protein n=1 Tax=Didymodactylos carnosus TaxID=1234261 RepID=A0A8S2DZ92_9BILA|nr:unnamed protein product [Didymodactylos carnosus]CAF3808085.1 unnamed protein product [Didymodactylos carnosus]